MTAEFLRNQPQDFCNMSDVKASYSDEYLSLITGCIRNWSTDWDILVPKEISLVIYDFYPKADKWNTELIDKSRLTVDTNAQTLRQQDNNIHQYPSY